MIKFIKKLLGICDHNWETIIVIPTSIEICDDTWYINAERHCQCTKCGAWKKFEV